MYAVIAGGGKVGRHVAADLVVEGHQVTIIEPVPGRCEDLVREHDPLVIVGDATSPGDLEHARTERADVFLAATGDDDDNFVACQLALTTFSVPRVVARVNLPRNEALFRSLGIEAISTTTLISRLILEHLPVGELVHLSTLAPGRLELVELDLPAQTPTRRLVELALPRGCVLVCIVRGDEALVPHGDTELRGGDRVVAVATPERERELRTALRGR